MGCTRGCVIGGGWVEQLARIYGIGRTLTTSSWRGKCFSDEIVPEPLGGAHRQPDLALDALGDRIEAALRKLTPLDGGTLRAKRRDKFLEIGRQGLA